MRELIRIGATLIIKYILGLVLFDFMKGLMKRGSSQLVSFVLLTSISIILIGIALIYGMPILDQQNDFRLFESSKTNMRTINLSLKEIVLSQGSSKTISIDLGQARLDMNEDTERIEIELKVKSELIAEGQNFKEQELNYNKQGNTIKIWLDLNGTAFDLNNSLSSSNGWKQLTLTNTGFLNEKAIIEVRER